MLIMSKIKRLFEILKGGDFDYILNAVSWRLPDWLFYYYHSFLFWTDRPKLITHNFTTYFKRFASHDDIEMLKKLGVREEFARRRLADGDLAVIMGKDEEILAIIWGTKKKRFIKLAGVVVDPGDDGAILYAAFVKKEARLKGLFPVIFHDIYRSFAKEGRNKLYAEVDSLNTNSLKLHLTMNFKITGETYYFIIFGISICYYKFWPFAHKRIQIFFRRPASGLEWV